MATVLNPFNSQDQEQQQGGSQPINTPQLGGQSAYTNASSSGPAPQKAPSSSGTFTNIQNYLRANQAPAQQLSGQIAGNIESQGTQAKNDLAAARSAFDQASNAGRLEKTSSLNKANDILQNAGQYVYGSGTTPNQQYISDFQRLTSGEYKGPQGIANAGNLTQQAQNAQQLGQLSGSESGRFALLRQMFNRPTYSQGQTKLDQLLVGANQQPLNQARQSVSGLPNYATQNITQAQRLADYYRNEAQDVGNQTRGLLTNAQTSAQKALSDKLAAEQKAESDRQAAFQRVFDNARKGIITQDDAQRLGLLSQGQDQKNVTLYGDIDNAANNFKNYLLSDAVVRPNNGLYEDFANAVKGASGGINSLENNFNTKISDTPLNQNTIASQEDAARMNALSRLAGQSSEPIDFSQVGKFQQSTQSLDQDKQKAVQNSVNTLNNYLSGIKAAEQTYNQTGLGNSLDDLNRYSSVANNLIRADDLYPVGLAEGQAPLEQLYSGLQDSISKAQQSQQAIQNQYAPQIAQLQQLANTGNTSAQTQIAQLQQRMQDQMAQDRNLQRAKEAAQEVQGQIAYHFANRSIDPELAYQKLVGQLQHNLQVVPTDQNTT